MTPIINPEIVRRLHSDITAKYERLTALQADYEMRIKSLYTQRNKLLSQRSSLEAILTSQELVEQSEELLSAPAPAQAEKEELVGELGPIRHPPGCSCGDPECPEWQATQR